MTETVEATIVDLTALLDDHTHDRCMVKAVTRHIPLPGGWRINYGTGMGCRRRAAAVITIVCPEHGEHAAGICRKHLALLRQDHTAAECAQCDREVVVRDLAS